MVKTEMPMDTGEVMDMIRERLSDHTGDDIAFIFNKEIAGPGEKLMYIEDSNFVLETPKRKADSFTWKVVWADISEVLEIHGKNLNDDNLNGALFVNVMEAAFILKVTLHFNSKEDKIAVGKSMIEDLMIKNNYVQAPKMFDMPERKIK